MLSCLKLHNLISITQHCFLPGISTVTQLLKSLRVWHKFSHSKSAPGYVVYIDFAKAFDTVSHPKLLFKVEKYGFSGTLLSWLTDFLFQRYQRVVLDGKCSLYTPVHSGIPQGSVMGPLLFLLYINDLPSVVPDNINLLIFADDVKLYNSPNDLNALSNIQAALRGITGWSYENQLKIASAKCSILPLQSKTHFSPDCYINGVRLAEVKSAKDLGILVTSNLRFTDHCHHIATLGYQQVNILFRCFSTADFQALLRGYLSFALPVLLYASPVWNPFQKTNVVLLERVQKYFTRRLFSRCSFSRTSYADRLKFLQIPTLEERRFRADLTYFFKIIKGYTVLDPTKFFKFNLGLLTRGHNYKLYTWFFPSDSSKNFFFNRHSTITAWNNLADEVVNSSSCSQFSRRLAKVDVSKYIHYDWFN